MKYRFQRVLPQYKLSFLFSGFSVPKIAKSRNLETATFRNDDLSDREIEKFGMEKKTGFKFSIIHNKSFQRSLF
jgi:hypothetical protein